MWITLKNLKKGWRWKTVWQMSLEEVDYYREYIAKHRAETTRLEELLKAQNINASDWIIISPMFIPVRNKNTPDKKYALNMNQMRNRNFIISNNLKQCYKELMKPYISHLPKLKNINIEYTIYRGKNEPDIMNIWSVISKFFLDTLQEEWILEDDKASIVSRETIINWWQDKWNERVEIKII